MATKSTEPVETVKVDKDDTRDVDLKKAYQAATSRLRETYKDEFTAMYVEEAAARGIQYTPRKTAEERRREQFQALLAEDPSLAALVTDAG